MMDVKEIIEKNLFIKRAVASLFYRYRRSYHYGMISSALNSCESKSVLLFTTHKCASTFLPKVLKLIQKKSDLEHFDISGSIAINGYKYDFGKKYENHEAFIENNYSFLFKSKGYIYGPLRKPFYFPGIKNYKKIFFLRDPRDVLISAYYSFGWTHSLPFDNNTYRKFLNERTKIQNESIDEYVVRVGAEWLLPVYDKYKIIKEDSDDDSLVLRYDEYMRDTKTFIKKIANYTSAELTRKQIALLSDKANPIAEKENNKSHKRSGRSRQFEEKLKKQTINMLNDTFCEALKYWGFE